MTRIGEHLKVYANEAGAKEDAAHWAQYGYKSLRLLPVYRRGRHLCIVHNAKTTPAGYLLLATATNGETIAVNKQGIMAKQWERCHLETGVFPMTDPGYDTPKQIAQMSHFWSAINRAQALCGEDYGIATGASTIAVFPSGGTMEGAGRIAAQLSAEYGGTTGTRHRGWVVRIPLLA